MEKKYKIFCNYTSGASFRSIHADYETSWDTYDGEFLGYSDGTIVRGNMGRKFYVFVTENGEKRHIGIDVSELKDNVSSGRAFYEALAEDIVEGKLDHYFGFKKETIASGEFLTAKKARKIADDFNEEVSKRLPEISSKIKYNARVGRYYSKEDSLEESSKQALIKLGYRVRKLGNYFLILWNK